MFFLLNHFSREIWCYIRPDFVGLFPLIIQRSNLDGGTPKSRWGDAQSRWGNANSRWRDVSPLQFKYWVQPYFEISLLSFIRKIFEQNFYQYITVYLVRIWTYKNADEKAHTFSKRSKNVKKRTNTDEKRIRCKFTFSNFF